MRCLGWGEAPYVRELEGNCLCEPTFWTWAGLHRLQVYQAPLKRPRLSQGLRRAIAICQAERDCVRVCAKPEGLKARNLPNKAGRTACCINHSRPGLCHSCCKLYRMDRLEKLREPKVIAGALAASAACATVCYLVKRSYGSRRVRLGKLTSLPQGAYDAVIVGAGPSGATCAYYLARNGASVALLDKETFPRDKYCGDAVRCKLHHLNLYISMP